MTSRSAAVSGWYRSLPHVTSAVAALVRDEAGRVLLARPVYKMDWVFVGGTVDRGEPPSAALRREIGEELGLPARLAPPVGRLLATDWIGTQPGWDCPMHSLVFDCGRLDAAVCQQITVPANELSSAAFLPVEVGARLLAPHEGKRLRMAVLACDLGTHYFLENGDPLS